MISGSIILHGGETWFLTVTSLDSLAGRAKGYGLNGIRSIPDRDKKIFSAPQRPHRL
jgi:hypothetical protein